MTQLTLRSQIQLVKGIIPVIGPAIVFETQIITQLVLTPVENMSNLPLQLQNLQM